MHTRDLTIAAAMTIAGVSTAFGQCYPAPLVGSLPGTYYTVAVSDNIAYLTNPTSITSVDVSVPAHPQTLGVLPGSFATSAWNAPIRARGPAVYIRHGSGRLVLVDASDPADMQLIAELPPIPNGGIGAVEFVGEHLYVFWGGRLIDDQTQVFDVSDPLAPVLLGVWDDGSSFIAGEGNLFVLYNEDKEELVVFDRTDPVSPTRTGALSLPITAVAGPLIGGVVVNSGVAHVNLATDYIISIGTVLDLFSIDLSKPSQPQVLSQVGSAWNQFAPLTHSGGVVFVPGDFQSGVTGFNVRDPASPAFAGTTLGVQPTHVAAQGDRLYWVHRSWNPGFRIFDFSDCLPCYADCDTSSGTGTLDVFDFLCFQDKFALGNRYACDCDTTTGYGVCDMLDFLCFHDAFVAGCQ